MSLEHVCLREQGTGEEAARERQPERLEGVAGNKTDPSAFSLLRGQLGNSGVCGPALRPVLGLSLPWVCLRRPAVSHGGSPGHAARGQGVAASSCSVSAPLLGWGFPGFLLRVLTYRGQTVPQSLPASPARSELPCLSSLGFGGQMCRAPVCPCGSGMKDSGSGM